MATTLTATAESADARVFLSVVNTPAPSSENVTFERSIDGGITWTLVRGPVPVPLLIGPTRNAYLYDYEMPLDVPVLYRATPDNGGAVDTDGPVTVLSGGLVWLKDPGRPWANVSMGDCVTPLACATPSPATQLRRLGTETRPVDAEIIPVLNRVRPADVYAVRKGVVASMSVLTQTAAARAAMELVLAAGGPILLQVPAAYDWPDRYWQPMDVDCERLHRDMRKPYRAWEVPLVEVEAPVGPAQGTVCNNLCATEAAYTTYATLTATLLTWRQIYEGDAAC